MVGGTWEPAGIRGDGRQSDGSQAQGPLSNEYQGGYCGVHGVLELGATAEMDPDAGYTATMQSACGAARNYTFYLSLPSTSATALAPLHRANDIADGLAVGASRVRAGGFGVQLPGCTTLLFDDSYPPASSQLHTRLPDVMVEGHLVRQWRVESRATHRAMCLTLVRGKSVPTGVTYYLPFELTVTEVLYPYPTLP